VGDVEIGGQNSNMLVDFRWTVQLYVRAHDSVVVKALRYDLEARRFETRRGERMNFFSIYRILPAAQGPGVHSASNRNEYQKQKSNISGE
jgi:hypothetical protein